MKRLRNADWGLRFEGTVILVAALGLGLFAAPPAADAQQSAKLPRIGVLQVTIWRNHGEKGNWYSVIPTRSYKQGDETWKETDSLGFDQPETKCKLH